MQNNLTGQQLGAYKLSELLGVGGMSAVYESYQTTVRRKVAVKVLPPQFAQQADYAERFEREVQLAALLEHPHILPIYDHGTDEGISYIVMRLLTGGTLAQRLEFFKRPSMREALQILRQIGSGLDYAHKQGIIHRDLKASNVLFDTEGNAYLSDFGIAKLLQNEPSAVNLTDTGQAMGTPAYMSPEQWRGENVDARADIYGLGIVAYMLLTDELPFQASTPYAMMHKHLHENPKPPSLIQPNLPTAVNSVIQRALAKDPTQRYPTAGSFVNALEEAIAEMPTQEHLTTGFLENRTFNATLSPVSNPLDDTQTPYQRKGRQRRNNGLVVVGLLLLGLILIGIGAFIVFMDNSDDDPQDNLAADMPSTTPNVITPNPSPNTPTAAAIAQEDTPLPTNTFTPTEAPTELPVVENLLRITAQTATEVELLQTIPGESAQDAAWSPDGQWLALARPDGIYLLALNDLQGTPRIFRGHEDDVTVIAFSPDATKIASGSDDNSVRIWDIETGIQIALLAGHTNNLHTLAFSPDGTQLASGGADGKVWLWNVTDGSGIVLGSHTASVEEVVFSPDGKLVASGSSDLLTRLWNVETHTMVIELSGHTDHVYTVAFNPAGTRLASGGPDRTILLWDTQEWEQLDALAPEAGWINNLKYSPDGSILASGGGSGILQLWNVTSDEIIATLRHGTPINKIAFNQAGTLLVSVSVEGDVKIWGLHQSGDALANLPVSLIEPTSINEVVTYDSLWTPIEGQFRDMQFPATTEYELAIDPTQTLRWNFVWCAANADLLHESLLPLTMKFFINGVDIGSRYLFEYEYAEGTESCHVWATIVRDWQFEATAGTPLIFDIRYMLTRQVTDGSKNYRAGEYIQRIRVSPAD